MLSFTMNEFKENSQFIQQQAQVEPVVIADTNNKQILINYSDYLKLVNQNAIKPTFNSAYDYFNTTLTQHFTDEELAILAEIEDDSDMSFLGQF